MRIFLTALNLIFLFLGTVHASQPNPDTGYHLFEENGLQGLKNENGQIVVPARYESLGWSDGSFKLLGNVIGYQENKAWGLLSLQNQKITEAKYSRLIPENSSYLIASRKNQPGFNQIGLIGSDGQMILPFQYASITIKGLRAIVSKKSSSGYQYGVINLKGIELLPLKYEFIKVIGSSIFLAKPFGEKARLYSDNAELVTETEMDSISIFRNNYAIIYNDYKRGLIKSTGEIKLQPDYQLIDVKGETAYIEPFNIWYQLTARNKKLNEFESDRLRPYSKESYLASSNGYNWLMSAENGNKLTAIYSKIISGETLSPIELNKKWGVINQSGDEKLAPKFDSVVVNSDLIFVKNKGLWALYDSFNIRKTDHIYTQIGFKTGKYFPVKRNNHWGFIDRYGELVIYCVYDAVGKFKNNMVAVSFHNKKGIIDVKGDWVVLPQDADSLQILNTDYYLAYKEGLKRLKTISEELIYFTENNIEVKDNYLLEYTSDGGIWKIDFSGRIVEEARDEKYEEVRAPSEGFYAIKKDGAYGFIDAQNRLRIANRYEDVGEFHNGLASFKLLGKWGFLNKKEELVIQPNYKKVSRFYGNVAIAYDNNGAGLINVEGAKVSSFSFDSLTIQHNENFLAYKNGNVGLLNASGRLMVNAKYETLQDLNNGFIIVSNAGKYGLVDINGVNTIPMQYHSLIYDSENDVYLAMKKSEPEKVTLQ